MRFSVFNSAVSETDPQQRFEIGLCQHEHHFTDGVENVLDFIKPITGLINSAES